MRSETEIGAMWLGGKECKQPLLAGQGKEWILPWSLQRNQPCQHLDFHTSDLQNWETVNILFKATKYDPLLQQQSEMNTSICWVPGSVLSAFPSEMIK